MNFASDFLDAFREPWRPLSAPALIGSLTFYCLFLLYAGFDRSGFLFIDNANLIVHEAGHLLFSYLGHTLMILGGTIFELFVPFALAVYFAWRRQPAGTAFCAFFFFDWFHIFSSLGLLQHDTQIATFFRILGWLGMLATMGWLAWRWKQSEA